jgi:hypothetical protein
MAGQIVPNAGVAGRFFDFDWARLFAYFWVWKQIEPFRTNMREPRQFIISGVVLTVVGFLSISDYWPMGTPYRQMMTRQMLPVSGRDFRPPLVWLIHLPRGRGLGSICTVAVMPAESTTPSGTSSIWMRTGTRWARRTQVKIGLTVTTPWSLGRALATLMARAILSTWPRTIALQPTLV